jgi:hypothetical protein
LTSFVLVTLLGAASLAAQVATGTIVGVVADSSGAVIPGAVITVVHQGTKETRQVRTNDRGEFNVPYMRIGEYAITAEAQGFQTRTQTGIHLQVDQTVKLTFSIIVGAMSERIEVTGAAPLIDTST